MSAPWFIATARKHIRGDIELFDRKRYTATVNGVSVSPLEAFPALRPPIDCRRKTAEHFDGIPPKGQHLAESVYQKQLAVTRRRRAYAVSVLMMVAVGVSLLMTVGVGAPDHQA